MRFFQTTKDIMEISSSHFSSVLVLLALAIGVVYVVRQENKVVAFAIRIRSYLAFLAVKQQYKRKGYAQYLLQQLRPSVSKLLVKPDNVKAIRLYARFGFNLKNTAFFLTGKHRWMVKSTKCL